jgi:hypothetical protein
MTLEGWTQIIFIFPPFQAPTISKSPAVSPRMLGRNRAHILLNVGSPPSGRLMDIPVPRTSPESRGKPALCQGLSQPV